MPGDSIKNLQQPPAPKTSGFELSDAEIVKRIREMKENIPYPTPELIIRFKATDESQLITMLDLHATINPTPGYISRGRLHSDPIVAPRLPDQPQIAENKPETSIELERDLALLYRWLRNKFGDKTIDPYGLRPGHLLNSILIYGITDLLDAFDKLEKAGCLSKTDSTHYKIINVIVITKPEVQNKLKEHKRRVGYATVIRHERKTSEMYAQDLLKLLNEIYPSRFFSGKEYLENTKIKEIVEDFPELSGSADYKPSMYLNYLVDKGYIRIIEETTKKNQQVKKLHYEIIEK